MILISLILINFAIVPILSNLILRFIMNRKFKSVPTSFNDKNSTVYKLQSIN